MGTILVVGAAVARTHEEIRLREPAHGASEVRAIDGKDLEILTVNVPYPAGNIGRLSVPRSGGRVAERGEARLAGGKLIESAEREPLVIARRPRACHRRHEVPH